MREMGLSGEKRLSFYTTTYNSIGRDVDIFRTLSLHDMLTMEDGALDCLTREVDNEMNEMVFAAG